jgi:hypothetical protein
MAVNHDAFDSTAFEFLVYNGFETALYAFFLTVGRNYHRDKRIRVCHVNLPVSSGKESVS